MVVIESVNNQKIIEIQKLQNKKERTLQQKFIVEGYHLVEEAKKHNLLESILTTNKNDFNKYNIDGYLVNEKIIKKLSTTVNAQEIIGIVKIPQYNINYKQIKRIVLLDNVNDPGNLGTIIRTSAALGIDAVIISLDTVDIYNEKVIRATQGSIFKIPVIKDDLSSVIKTLKKNNISIYGTSLDTNTYITDIKKVDKYAVIFGNEANGVRREINDLVDKKFKIEMHNDVESLNVAVACAIVIYHFNM